MSHKVFYIIDNKILSWEVCDTEIDANIAASNFRLAWEHTGRLVETPVCPHQVVEVATVLFTVITTQRWGFGGEAHERTFETEEQVIKYTREEVKWESVASVECKQLDINEKGTFA